ncbi:UNVERIFIED_CONTAM: hypothetical protein GTU68_060685 [Idotea baltica]|nr:hypothetical protein [Idotea baltica]
MKDLGSWMREEYSIAGQPATELDVLQHNANTSDDSE